MNEIKLYFSQIGISMELFSMYGFPLIRLYEISESYLKQKDVPNKHQTAYLLNDATHKLFSYSLCSDKVFVIL